MIEKRFKYEYKRGHGPGGQHKNKVETCVVATDPVTGFTETCQDSRSREMNKRAATHRLKKRIVEHDVANFTKLKNEVRKKSLSMGVIRTYDYKKNEVRDHRTGKKANLKKVMNGALDLIRKK